MLLSLFSFSSSSSSFIHLFKHYVFCFLFESLYYCNNQSVNNKRSLSNMSLIKLQLIFCCHLNANNVRSVDYNIESAVMSKEVSNKVSSMQLQSDLFSKPNLAVVLHGKNDLRLQEWPLPDKLGPYGEFDLFCFALLSFTHS